MSIHIKKINNFTSFCGLDSVSFDKDFKDYNVIFANNGAGKTSVTRAFELLIKKNTHISKYQTINAQISPSIDFQLNSSSVVINDSSILASFPFKIEIYNSDFLQHNAPLNSEFGLKKLDDETIVLEGSAIGEETKELEKLNSKIEKCKTRQIEIGNLNDIDNIDEESKIKQLQDEINKAIKGIEQIRKTTTSTAIQVKLDDFVIKSTNLYDISEYSYDEKKLVNVERQFNELNIAIKQFDLLEDIYISELYQVNNKVEIDSIFEFDIKKEAGEVGRKVKEHIIEVGEKFIKDGRKLIKDTSCPFCIQPIDNGILNEYANYFNEAVDKFDNLSQNIENNLRDEIKIWEDSKDIILSSFEKFKPFIKNFEENKTNIDKFINDIIKQIKQFKKLVTSKKGIEQKKQYNTLFDAINKNYQSIESIIKQTSDILENKKQQVSNLQKIKLELKNIKIQKAKKDSFNYQKSKYKNEQKIVNLKKEFFELDALMKHINKDIQELQNKRRPDIKIINSYLNALNLSKYSVNKDYQITMNTSLIIQNDNLRIVLSEGEKTTIAFAYFLARLKLFYNKSSLKNLLIVIDDPISSLDENRVYNTSYLVAKINQEIAGEILLQTDDKAQIFVFTHSHIFMTNIIRILGKHASYFQLSRKNDSLEFISKDKVAGYFDTFYLLLFKEILIFAENTTLIEDFNIAINNGNKIRILLESFMKTNFISEFIKIDYKSQSSFDSKTIQNIVKRILDSNNAHQFSNSFFKDMDCLINDNKELELKLDRVVKGLHMDSHGSITDFYSQYKLSVFEVQKFAKIAINIMTALNPNQTYFYIEASKNQ